MNRTTHMRRGDAARATGSDASLVQIGLPTGARVRTGFEATRRDVLSLMGFSLGALGLGRVPRAGPARGAAAGGVDRDGAGRAQPLRHHLRRLRRVLRPGRQAARRASDQDRGQRGLAADGRRDLRGRPGQRAVAVRRRAAARAGLAGEPGVVARDRSAHQRRCSDAGGARSRARSCCCRRRSPARRRGRCSPSFERRFPSFRHVVYDPMSLAALREANRLAFGAAVVPHFRFDRARVVVALEADFLGTWLAPVEFARQWARRAATADGTPLHSTSSAKRACRSRAATPTCALAVAPSELGTVAVALLAAVARRVGDAGLAALSATGLGQTAPHAAEIDRGRRRALAATAANRWWSRAATTSRRRSWSASSTRCWATSAADRRSRAAVAAAAGRRRGDGRADRRHESRRGAARCMLWGANPVYDHPDGLAFRKALGRVPLTISFADRRDETSAHVHALCPDHHFLESWGDAEPVSGHFSLAQPLIAPLHDTRAAAESLLAWVGPRRPTIVPTCATSGGATLYPRAASRGGLRRLLGAHARTRRRRAARVRRCATHAFAGDWQGAVRDIVTRASRAGTDHGGYELALHETVGARDGRHANNPWLLELPDPITRLTWGNVASIAPATAAALGVATGDVVTLTTETGEAGAARVRAARPGAAHDLGGGRLRPLGRRQGGRRRRRQRLSRSPRVEHGAAASPPASRWRRPAAAPASPPRRPTSRWRAATSSSRSRSPP